MSNTVYFGDNLKLLESLPDEVADLIYIDPPFNTGKMQGRRRLKTVRAEDGEGDRIGFGGKSYQTEVLGHGNYNDVFADFEAFILPRLQQAYRVLKADGSFYFHIDYREAHYCKVALDQIFGRENFINEIIWAYDFGGRAKDRWPAKHDTIFFYAKDRLNFTFNVDDIDRIPYMAPGLVGPEKAAKGKLPTDTWWHTIVGTNSREKTGYPTQKPIGILERIVRASSDPGDLVLDFFAGSGTTGQACLNLGRKFILCDSNPQAIEIMKKRFALNVDIEWKLI
ncbi:MAG: DNA methyltransferase [Anaerolineaceae bacterium]|jgi:site-specific DNA-methyltransferase (adenine-specific)|nr:DNA methyltransferase [Anaerolineaceae bacterium]MDD4042321.1 DNA methyltransferase [Anaerolineaceae bacterium]MDD4577740.1 DNA methyltransferase [Anaerolineaceae bacterium]